MEFHLFSINKRVLRVIIDWRKTQCRFYCLEVFDMLGILFIQTISYVYFEVCYIYNSSHTIEISWCHDCMFMLFLITLDSLSYFPYSSHNLQFTEWASYISFDKFWKPFPYGTLRQKDHNPVENFFSFCKLGKAYLIYLCDV